MFPVFEKNPSFRSAAHLLPNPIDSHKTHFYHSCGCNTYSCILCLSENVGLKPLCSHIVIPHILTACEFFTTPYGNFAQLFYYYNSNMIVMPYFLCKLLSPVKFFNAKCPKKPFISDFLNIY